MPAADTQGPLYLTVQGVCLCFLLSGSCIMNTCHFPAVLSCSDKLAGSACQDVWQAHGAFPCCEMHCSRQCPLTRSCCQGCASGPGWSARWLPTAAELGTGPAAASWVGTSRQPREQVKGRIAVAQPKFVGEVCSQAAAELLSQSYLLAV